MGDEWQPQGTGINDSQQPQAKWVGLDPVLGSAALLDSGRRWWHRSTGQGRALLTLFQKASPHVCLLPPEGLGSPWSGMSPMLSSPAPHHARTRQENPRAVALLPGLVCCPLRSQASGVQSREDEWPAGPAVTCPAPSQTVWGLRFGGHRAQAHGRCSALRGVAAVGWACHSLWEVARVRCTTGTKLLSLPETPRGVSGSICFRSFPWERIEDVNTSPPPTLSLHSCSRGFCKAIVY